MPAGGKRKQPKLKALESQQALQQTLGPMPDNQNSKSKEKGTEQTPDERNPPEFSLLLGDGSRSSHPSSGDKNETATSDQSVLYAAAITAMKAGESDKAAKLWKVYLASPASSAPSATAHNKRARDDSVESIDTPVDQNETEGPLLQEGSIEFAVNGINLHKDVGFPPFFDKNIRELKGPIPLTIFNKKWQDCAIAHHADKRQRSDNDSSDKVPRYTGLPYPSEWLQTLWKKRWYRVNKGTTAPSFGSDN
ncbi:hypothetical protein MJO29_015005 [Puccinia striiformis f. sp. tritici]|nr:hypothetical protein Pst134EB_028591 [Puccinia striiformis f. sp. tritici]KAI7937690.1 hypothetical protein MJO29_015005 [Puccinia striiformis f. sp. tritici]